MPFIRSHFFVDSPIRAIKFLTQTLGFPPALAQKTIDKSRLRIGTNGAQIAHKSDMLQGSVWLTHFTHDFYEASVLTKPFFCTQDFALFDKPPKILTHPKGNFLHKSLLDSIRFFCGNEAQSVHRLDFETSGAILVARHKKAQIALKNALMNRQIQKTYLAKVRGEIKSECVIDAPIITPARPKSAQKANQTRKNTNKTNKDCKINKLCKNLSIRSKIDYHATKSLKSFDKLESFGKPKSFDESKDFGKLESLQLKSIQNGELSTYSKPAITRIIPLYFDGAHTFIKAIPLTGRTHQIRLHLAHIGHAIENDFLYGVSDEVSERYLDELRILREQEEQNELDKQNPSEQSAQKKPDKQNPKIPQGIRHKAESSEILYADKVLALHSLSVDFVFDGVRYVLGVKKPAWWEVDKIKQS